MSDPGPPADDFPFEIGAAELKARLDRGEEILLLDVRQPWEHEYARIPGSILLPVPELPERIEELDPDRAIVAYCKVGERSAWAVDFLRQAGFTRVRNLRGGIYGWAEEVDPGVLP
jgi:adenylyltransferase/sulfurtransferase